MKKHSPLVHLVTAALLGLFLGTAVHAATLAETKLCYMLGDLGTSITTARDLGAPIEQARAIALATRTGGGPALDAEWQLYGLRLIDGIYQSPSLTGVQIRGILEANCLQQFGASPPVKPAPVKPSKRY